MPRYDIRRNSVTQKTRVKKDCTWFVVPWDDDTRNRIATELSEGNHYHSDITLSNGIVIRGVWECPLQIIGFLKRAGGGVKFTVFRRRGNRFEEIPFWGNVKFPSQ